MMVDRIRILMGDEVSKRTKAAFNADLQQIQTKLNDSLEAEKEKNDFLEGASAIVEALRSGKIVSNCPADPTAPQFVVPAPPCGTISP
jgi:hypothetical protein